MPAKNGGQLVIGIDLGGTNMQLGVVTEDNRIIGAARKKTKASEGADRVPDRLVKGVQEACEDAGIQIADIAAIGIATAGAVDIPNGVVLDSPNIGWYDFALRDILEKKLDRPVVVDNDVNGAVWGEYHLGAGRGEGDVLGVWVGTGIGGGLVLNSQLYYGEFFTAGEVGHTVLFPDGEPGRRTVEDMCSRSGMARVIRDGLVKYPDAPVVKITDGTGQITGSRQLREAVEAECPLTTRAVNRAADLLGVAIAGWITVLALDNVIVGGGVTEALGEKWLDRVRRSFEANVFPDRCKACEITATKLKDNAGLLGAALLARAAVSGAAKKPRHAVSQT